MATSTASSSSRASWYEKPLPSLPSPTLSSFSHSNMVLPDDLFARSPESPIRTNLRPPSPGYLRDKTSAAVQSPAVQSPSLLLKKKEKKLEKRGLMSRKMALLRSRTNSGLHVNTQQTTPSSASAEEQMVAFASSPTLNDVGGLAPETTLEDKRLSVGSSLHSEELEGLPGFLARYENVDSGTDEELWGRESPALEHGPLGYTVSIQGGRTSGQEEQSAALSRRAEMILANAKKRLNLMEGNLRNARNTIASPPLTAANLKRATSLGSSAFSAERSEALNRHAASSLSRTSSGRGRFFPNAYHNESPAQQPRLLHSQASSPALNQQGHFRGFSETELPERPHTALARSGSFQRGGRIVPIKPRDSGQYTTSLRGSRSHDTLGGGSGGRTTPLLHKKGSPDSNLEPLAEDDASLPDQDAGLDRNAIGLGLHRSPSTTEDLREQMSSLKGRISNLKERAREDSMRRQSMQNLRPQSPFTHAQPENWYTASPSYNSSPVLDTNAGVGWSKTSSPLTPQSQEQQWPVQPSRNAFAQQLQIQQEQREPNVYHYDAQRYLEPPDPTPQPLQHKRSASGTALIQPAEQRFTHHKNTHINSSKMPGGYDQYESSDDGSYLLTPTASPQPDREDDHYVSEDGSVYEDAAYEQPPVQRHEDREDAFDYEHFFLHSAMGSYTKPRSGSLSSNTSVETAKGPSAFVDAGQPPATPETPEVLRQIEERYAHKRTMSDESLSTLDSFATATEGRASALDWPIPPTEPAVPARRSSSSERADSGVGIPRRSQSPSSKSLRSGATTPRLPPPPTTSPPMSPTSLGEVLHDRSSVAVGSLLDPRAKPLGLKDKALVFGLVESLREVCGALQREEYGGYQGRVLRRRLDGARRCLEGVGE